MTVLVGDCVERMRELAAGSVDAVVCDPPYGLEFMGKEWDRLTPTGGARFTEDGMGKGFRAMPSFHGSPNPACRHCGGTLRGRNRKGFRRCDCDAPDFPNVRRNQAQAMQAWHEAWATEALRVLKPGGHLLAFGGTRTVHRLACALEDAGFEIRDTIAWMYGSGFPKSLDVSKAIAPATPEAQQWQGWGTALKPAHEPIVVARKPLAGTVAGNVLEHGTGALNIDGCRVGTESTTTIRSGGSGANGIYGADERVFTRDNPAGRWPANVVLSHTEDCVQVGTRQVKSNSPATYRTEAEAALYGDGLGKREPGDARPAYGADGRETVAAWDCAPECPVRLLDEQTGERGGGFGISTRGGGETGHWNPTDRTASRGQTIRGGGELVGYGDSGGASRFFYTAKSSRAERNAGLDGFETVKSADDGYGSIQTPKLDRAAPRENWQPHKTANHHPTVKPLALMRWLVRLVTPPGGIVLDPFTGSGTTGIACALEGFRFLGIERDEEYAAIAEARIAFWEEHGEDGLRIVAERDRAEQARAEVAAAGQLDLFEGTA